MSTRSAECQCNPSLTCSVCLRNAPPWHFTPRTHREAMADAQDKDREQAERAIVTGNGTHAASPWRKP